MKKILLGILLVIMFFSFIACCNEERAEKNCLSCGKNISSEAFFCEHCGASVKDTNNSTADDKTSPTVEPTNTPMPTAKLDATDLVGNWIACNNVEYVADGEITIATCLHINFFADGTFEQYRMSQLIRKNGAVEEATTRHVYGGTYSIENDMLKLHYTLFNSGAPDSEFEPSVIYAKYEIDINDEVLQIFEMRHFEEFSDTFYRGKTVKEIADNML